MWQLTENDYSRCVKNGHSPLSQAKIDFVIARTFTDILFHHFFKKLRAVLK